MKDVSWGGQVDGGGVRLKTKDRGNHEGVCKRKGGKTQTQGASITNTSQAT